MAKRIKKSAEYYRAALLGVADRKGELTPGLRAVAKGFKASEGYNLRDLREGRWTPAMKRKVTMYQRELNQMTAQEKIVIRTRSPDRLQKAQAVGGHDPKYKFKVAFVPGSAKSEVIWNDDNTPTVKDRGYSRIPAHFDGEALAIDPQAEIARVLALPKMRKAQRFGILTGANVMLGEGIPTRKGLAAKVLSLMARYDGIKELPRGSGNRGDKPSAHHYSRWLVGIQGFQFRHDPDKVAPTAFDKIAQGNAEQRRRHAAARGRAKTAAKRGQSRKGK